MSGAQHEFEPVAVPALAEFARSLVATGEVSAVVVGVGTRRRLASAVAGVLDPTDQDSRPVTTSTWFDIASLTKPFAATVALVLDRRGDLSLSAPLAEYIPGLPPVVRRFPLEAIWRHQAGLVPWFPFYTEASETTVVRFADAALWKQATGPHGRACERAAGGAQWAAAAYSDLGPILWSLLARAAGCDLGAALAECGLAAVYEPESTTTAATALSNRREVELAAALGIRTDVETVVRRGIPQDGNARVIHQSGHAGLFANLEVVLGLGTEWLQPRLLDQTRVDSALRSEGRYALGWWRADPGRDALPPTAFGHNGFTGCSLWLERERQRIMVLLAHRTTLSDTLDRARREFHSLALDMTF